MRGYKRTDRLSELIKQEIAELIVAGEIKDPRIGFVTITRVKVSSDLSYADVYYSVMDGKWDETREGLESSRYYIQSCVGRDLRIKKLPKLRFFEDRSLDYVEHIESLLERVKGEGEDSEDT
ncbi:MAG: 30S ribosome-binding factor RbfA [Deferribacteres bacterium]|nr:30S ribosome-binding factor RbfA [Deferribacteres bacterium]